MRDLHIRKMPSGDYEVIEYRRTGDEAQRIYRDYFDTFEHSFSCARERFRDYERRRIQCQISFGRSVIENLTEVFVESAAAKGLPR